MKKKMVFGMVFTVLLVSQVFALNKYDYDFKKELNRNNLRNIERLLERRSKQMDLTYCLEMTIESSVFRDTKGFNKSNCLDVVKLLVRHGADVNRQYTGYSTELGIVEFGYPLENAVTYEHPLSVIQFLLDSGADPNKYSSGENKNSPLWWAYPENMPVANLLLDRGANGADILRYVAGEGDNEFMVRLFDKGVNVRSDAGRDALIAATQNGHFDTVQILVLYGVNVNARDKDGASALNYAYDKGEMEIYNYLLANGAVEFERKPQIAQQPAAPAQSTTNVYVQPSAPTQSAQAPAQNTAPNVAQQLQQAFQSPLQSGTYSLAGTQEKIRITAIAKSGVITQTWQGRNYQGTYNIDGNRMTVQIRGATYVFNITSGTSFSGHGETWVRTGY